MTGAYVYTPAIWPPLVAAAFLAAIALYAWRRRDVPAVVPFLAILLFTSLLLLGIALESAAVTSATKIAWYKFQFLMTVLAVTSGTCFSLEYAYPGRWLTHRNLILLSIGPLLTLLLILVDDSRFIWRLLQVGPDGSVVPYFAVAGGILLAYAWGLVFVNAAVLVWLFIRSPQHRWPVAIMLCGQITGRAAYLLNFASAPSPTAIDPTVLTALATAAGYAIAMFGFHVLDPLPAARQTVIEQMHAGMVVFDTDWHVVSLNPAAERILAIRAGAARGKTWRQLQVPGRLLPTLPDDTTQPADAETELPELTFGTGTGARHYAPELSGLRDFRGPLMGYLLMLRDVTEQTHAQARLLEQQQITATLRERERLARELHDGLAQSLAAAHLQASTAKLLLTQGATADVGECLDGIVETTLQAETDVRDYLLAAKTGISAGRTFFPALREHLQRFTRQYGLPVELSVPPELEEHGLAPAVEVQLLRIIQEALSNVRKHACANHVQVCFSIAEHQLRVAVIDDGLGFDPATLASAGGGYGLRAMRERAEALSGSLTVSSRPSQGTEVVALLPLEH